MYVPGLEPQLTQDPATLHLPGCPLFRFHPVTTAALCPWQGMEGPMVGFACL